MLTIALTLLALTPDGPAPSPLDDGQPVEAEEWTGTLGAGLTTSSGNTERRSLHAQVDAVLRQETRRYSVGFDWQYADEAADGPTELLERRAGANGQVDFFLDEQSYLLVTADVETDHKAELDLRYSAGLGYGYQVAEEEDWSLSFEAGMSVINEQFVGEDEDSYLSGRFGYSLKRDLGESWTLSQDSEIFPSFEDTEDVHLEVDSRLRCDLSKNLYGQFQWLFDWDNTPADGAERADHRLLLSVGYSF
jgi:putative salt-induced outer membrane protein YdiY